MRLSDIKSNSGTQTKLKFETKKTKKSFMEMSYKELLALEYLKNGN